MEIRRKIHPSVWKNGCYYAKVTVGQKNCVLHSMVPVEDDNKAVKQFWTDSQMMAKHPELKTSAADTLIITGDFNGELPAYDEELAKTSQSVVEHTARRN